MLEPSSGLSGHCGAQKQRSSHSAHKECCCAFVRLAHNYIGICMKTPLRTIIPIKSVIFFFLIFSISNIQESLQTQKLQETTLETTPETTAQTATELLNIYSDDEYIRKIQKRLEEDTLARQQREKRRRKMLMEQLIAHEAEEVRKCMLKYITNVQLVI